MSSIECFDKNHKVNGFSEYLKEEGKTSIDLILYHPFMSDLILNKLAANKLYKHLLCHKDCLTSFCKGLKYISKEFHMYEEYCKFFRKLVIDFEIVENIIKSLIYHYRILTGNIVALKIERTYKEKNGRLYQLSAEYSNYIQSICKDQNISLNFLAIILSTYILYHEVGIYLRQNIELLIHHSLFTENWIKHFTSQQAEHNLIELCMICDKMCANISDDEKKEMKYFFKKILHDNWVICNHVYYEDGRVGNYST